MEHNSSMQTIYESIFINCNIMGEEGPIQVLASLYKILTIVADTWAIIEQRSLRHSQA